MIQRDDDFPDGDSLPGPPGPGEAPAPDDPPSWTPRDELADSISLVRRVQDENDRRALEELMFRYRPRLVRKVRVMMSEGLQQRFDIDDIVQAALVKGVRDLSGFEFREPASLIHWLTGIALNEIRAMSRKRLPGSFEQDADSSSQLGLLPGAICERELLPPEEAEREEAKARLDEAIGRLPDHYRDVLLARDYDGGTWDHVAEVMGRSPEACQMIRKRAKDQLLRLLQGKEL